MQDRVLIFQRRLSDSSAQRWAVSLAWGRAVFLVLEPVGKKLACGENWGGLSTHSHLPTSCFQRWTDRGFQVVFKTGLFPSFPACNHLI